MSSGSSSSRNLSEDAGRPMVHESRDDSVLRDFDGGRSAVSSSSLQPIRASSHPLSFLFHRNTSEPSRAVSETCSMPMRSVRFADDDEVREFVVDEEYKLECQDLIDWIGDNVEARERDVDCFRSTNKWPEELQEELDARRLVRFNDEDQVREFVVDEEYELECQNLIGRIGDNVEARGRDVDCFFSTDKWPEDLEEELEARRRIRFRAEDEIREFVVDEEYELECQNLIRWIEDNAEERGRDVDCFRSTDKWPEELEEEREMRRRRRLRRRVRCQLVAASDGFLSKQRAIPFTTTIWRLLFLHVFLFTSCRLTSILTLLPKFIPRPQSSMSLPLLRHWFSSGCYWRQREHSPRTRLWFIPSRRRRRRGHPPRRVRWPRQYRGLDISGWLPVVDIVENDRPPPEPPPSEYIACDFCFMFVYNFLLRLSSLFVAQSNSNHELGWRYRGLGISGWLPVACIVKDDRPPPEPPPTSEYIVCDFCFMSI